MVVGGSVSPRVSRWLSPPGAAPLQPSFASHSESWSLQWHRAQQSYTGTAQVPTAGWDGIGDEGPSFRSLAGSFSALDSSSEVASLAVSTSRSRVSVRDAGSSGVHRRLKSSKARRDSPKPKSAGTEIVENQQDSANRRPGMRGVLENNQPILTSQVLTEQLTSTARTSASPKWPFTSDPWAPPSENDRVRRFQVTRAPDA
jgi:hypothetical protein